MVNQQQHLDTPKVAPFHACMVLNLETTQRYMLCKSTATRNSTVRDKFGS